MTDIQDKTHGPHVIDGKLFFKLLDGSTISCECIGEPYVTEIVKLWQAARKVSDYWDEMWSRLFDHPERL